jgi:hypothetical protein
MAVERPKSRDDNVALSQALGVHWVPTSRAINWIRRMCPRSRFRRTRGISPAQGSAPVEALLVDKVRRTMDFFKKVPCKNLEHSVRTRDKLPTDGSVAAVSHQLATRNISHEAALYLK